MSTAATATEFRSPPPTVLAPPTVAEMPRWECWALAAIIAVYILLNTFTASRSPTVWMDEVMLTDPAATYHLGHGFRSSAWAHETKDETYSYNGLAHQGLLVVWMKLFGFNPTAVRSLNYVLMSVMTLFACAGARRSGVVPSPGGRVALALLLLCGYGITFSYRSGRYDVIGAAELAACFYCATLRNVPFKLTLLALLGAMMIWTGIQLVPLGMMLGALLVLFVGRRTFLPLGALGAGWAIGFASLYGILSKLGMWSAFVRGVANNNSSATAGGGAGELAHRLVGAVKPTALAIAKGDYSALPLLVLLAVAAVLLLRARQSIRLPLFGIFVLIGIPLGMTFAGRFPIYYAWMSYLPACVVAAGVWDRWVRTAPLALHRFGGAGLIAVACVIGLPLRTALLLLEWNARDYKPVQALVNASVRPSDWAYCDYAAFYPTKRIAEWTFTSEYLRIMSPIEKSRVTVLIVSPEFIEKIEKEIGGSWQKTGQSLAPPQASSLPFLRGKVGAKLYSLDVYRRTTDAPTITSATRP